MCQSCSTAAVSGAPVVHTSLSPFVPNVSILRFPTGIFELHLYLPGIVSKVEVVPHDNYLLVRGNVGPRILQDVRGRAGALVYTDQVNGEFSRHVPICLSPGTEFVVLDTRQEAHHYIMRYTIRNSLATGYCGNNATPIINNHTNGLGGGGTVHGVGIGSGCEEGHVASGYVGHVNSEYVGGHIASEYAGGHIASGHGGHIAAGGHVASGCVGGHVLPIVNRINTPRSYITTSIS